MSTPSRCDRRTPPTGAQQPPPFSSTGSPLHDFKDTVSERSPPPPLKRITEALNNSFNYSLKALWWSPNDCVAYRTSMVIHWKAHFAICTQRRGGSGRKQTCDNIKKQNDCEISWAYPPLLLKGLSWFDHRGKRFTGFLVPPQITRRMSTLHQPRIHVLDKQISAGHFWWKSKCHMRKSPFSPTLSSALPQPWLLGSSQAVSCLLDNSALWGAMACRVCRTEIMSEGSAGTENLP